MATIIVSILLFLHMDHMLEFLACIFPSVNRAITKIGKDVIYNTVIKYKMDLTFLIYMRERRQELSFSNLMCHAIKCDARDIVYAILSHKKEKSIQALHRCIIDGRDEIFKHIIDEMDKDEIKKNDVLSSLITAAASKKRCEILTYLLFCYMSNSDSYVLTNYCSLFKLIGNDYNMSLRMMKFYFSACDRRKCNDSVRLRGYTQCQNVAVLKHYSKRACTWSPNNINYKHTAFLDALISNNEELATYWLNSMRKEGKLISDDNILNVACHAIRNRMYKLIKFMPKLNLTECQKLEDALSFVMEKGFDHFVELASIIGLYRVSHDFVKRLIVRAKNLGSNDIADYLLCMKGDVYSFSADEVYAFDNAALFHLNKGGMNSFLGTDSKMIDARNKWESESKPSCSTCNKLITSPQERFLMIPCLCSTHVDCERDGKNNGHVSCLRCDSHTFGRLRYLSNVGDIIVSTYQPMWKERAKIISLPQLPCPLPSSSGDCGTCRQRKMPDVVEEE